MAVRNSIDARPFFTSRSLVDRWIVILLRFFMSSRTRRRICLSILTDTGRPRGERDQIRSREPSVSGDPVVVFNSRSGSRRLWYVSGYDLTGAPAWFEPIVAH